MAVYTKKSINKKASSKKTFNIVAICVLSILFINLLFNIIPFINSFMLGVFGLLYYVFCICGILYFSLSLAGKRVVLTTKQTVLLSLWFVFFVMIIHLITSYKFITSYGSYLSSCYEFKHTAGGVIFGVFAYIIPYLTHVVAAYIFNAIALVIVSAMFIEDYISNKHNKVAVQSKTTTNIVQEDNLEEDNSDQEIESVSVADKDSEIFVKDEEVKYSQDEVSRQANKDKAKILLGLKKQSEISPNGKQVQYVSDEESDDGIYDYNKAKKAGVSTSNYILTPSTYDDLTRGSRKPSKIVHTNLSQDTSYTQKTNETPQKSRKLTERDERNLEFLRASQGNPTSLEEDNSKDLYDENLTLKKYKSNSSEYLNKVNSIDNAYNQINNNNISFESEELSFTPISEYRAPSVESSNKVKSIDEYLSHDKERYGDNSNKSSYKPAIKASPYTLDAKDDEIVQAKTTEQISIVPIKDKPAPKPKYRKPSKYIRPPLDLLRSIPSSDLEVTEEIKNKGRMIENALAEFKITAKIETITKGPAFTRYELTIPSGQGISVKRIANYADDIAMAIQSKGNIRLQLPIPGKNAFGIEVPNDNIAAVGLRDILESYNFQKSKSPLTFALGKDITSECIVSTIDKCTHMLVAGSTGSGKSVCLNTILLSLMYKTSPEDLKFILIDPKRVEFSMYADLPHMLIPKPINDPLKAVDALSWVVKEMERRYTLLSNAGVHKIDEYNERVEVQQGIAEKLYYLVVVVDELNDLMMQARKEVEEKIIRIAQLARAAGIHLIVATQRPSVDVITGTIKGNLPTRIAFAVTSYIDSKTILDCAGAETLLGRGDMLFSPNGSNELHRIQGAYVTNQEIANIVQFIKDNNEAYFDETIEDEMFNKNKNGGFDTEGQGSAEQFDPLLKDALRTAIKTQYMSPSNLQRKYHIGWNRAASIVDQMVAAGFISEPDERHKYTIFITEQEFEEKFGEDFE